MKSASRLVILCLIFLGLGLVIGRSFAPPQVTPYSLEEEAGLLKIVPDVAFDQIPFERAVEMLNDMTGAMIVVQWQAVHPTGVERDTPVTVHAQNRPLEHVLALMLLSIPDSHLMHLQWQAHNGVVSITTRDSGFPPTVCRIYDLQPIVMNLMARNSRHLHELTRARLGLPALNNWESHLPSEPTPEQIVDDLSGLLEETIEPESWYDQSGNVGSTFPLNTLLIVKNRIPVHDEIRRFLAALEEASKR